MNHHRLPFLFTLTTLASIGHAQSLADCTPATWRSGPTTVGSVVDFSIGSSPNCYVAYGFAFTPGPTQFGSQLLPIGADAVPVIALIPANGAPVTFSLPIPNQPSLAGIDLFTLGVGAVPTEAALNVGAAGRFRIAGPSPSVGSLVILSEHALDNGTSTVITAAQQLGTTPEFLTNDSATVLQGNPWLPWSTLYAGSEVTLPMGGPGNEGMFTLTAALPFPLASLVAGTVPQLALGEVGGVMPIRNQDFASMVGQTFVAIVHDGAIGQNYAPLVGNLQGERYGLFAFTVLEVVLPGTVSESGSSSSFYDLRIRVEGPMAAGAPFVATPRDVPSDSIQIDQAIWQNGVLTVTAQSGVGSNATMTVSVDGFTFESPMTYSALTAQYEARFYSPISLVGSRITISTAEGGSNSGTVQ